MSHKKPQKVIENQLNQALEEAPEEIRQIISKKPWETSSEYVKFMYFLLCPHPRSVRAAYRLYCEDNGIKPRKNPPSSWYKLFRGEYLAFRKADRKAAAIQRAGEVHGRFPDWERLEATAQKMGDIGKDTSPAGQVMDSLMLLDYAFVSLAIDDNGDPIPGELTWQERNQAYWDAVASGKEPAPEGWDGKKPNKT